MALNDSTEKRIIAAARKEFIENGFKGARMQAIANSCQVNKALLHYYFRSKERLYEAVFQDIAITLRIAIEEQFEKLDTNTGLPAFLRSIITAYMRTLQKNSDFPQFILRELSEGGKRLPAIIETLAPSMQHLPATMQRILSHGETPDASMIMRHFHLMLNLIGMCVFTFIARPIVAEVNRYLKLNIEYNDDFFNARIDAILDLVLNGILRPCPPGVHS